MWPNSDKKIYSFAVIDTKKKIKKNLDKWINKYWIKRVKLDLTLSVYKMNSPILMDNEFQLKV